MSISLFEFLWKLLFALLEFEIFENSLLSNCELYIKLFSFIYLGYFFTFRYNFNKSINQYNKNYKSKNATYQ